MKKQIAADELLDSVKFRISPDDRYYVFIYCGDKEEKVGSSRIGQLTAHLREGLYSDSEKSYANFKLELPEHLRDATWFTKTTVTRFLELIDSPDALKKIFAMSNEMLQLEETKKFHLSLHRQGMDQVRTSSQVQACTLAKFSNSLAQEEELYRDSLMNDDADKCNSNTSVQTTKKENGSADNSKNELLRAMDLRITALGDELVAAFNQAGGSTSPSEVILNLEKFCQHFGAADLSNVLSKLLGMNLIAINPPNEPTKCVLAANKTTDNAQSFKTLNLDQLVRYGASPAKAAELERQSSTSGEDQSSSSEEDMPSTERSRNMSRSATPRRSASPMRRIQIGRSGSRRTPAITIKSLSSFPGRDKTFSLKDAAETDRFEMPSKASAESNARRMSVQDAISLFERKQKDQTTDPPNWKIQADNNPANASKSVLRRWSSSVGETSAQCSDQSAYEQNLPATRNELLDETLSNSSPGVQPITDILPCPPDLKKAAQVCEELDTRKENSPSLNDAEISVKHPEGAGKMLDRAEWSRKKEAELNQMLMSFVQSKPSKSRNLQAVDSKNLDSGTGIIKERKNLKLQAVDSKKLGSGTGIIKERKNQKLQAENTGKKTDKQAKPRTIPKALNKAKPEMSSSNTSNIVKKQPVNKAQKEKVIKSIPLISSSKRELPKPDVSKGPLKPSPLPATRKSWPLPTPTPTPRSTRTSSSKTPISTPTSATTGPRQKSQSPASLSRLSPKLETPKQQQQQQQKDVKNMQVDTKKSSKSTEKSKGQVAPRSLKAKKTEAVNSLDSCARVPAKPNLAKKVPRKSTVVPLEPKPSPPKGSGEKTSSTISKKAIISSPLKERVSKSEVTAETAAPVEVIELDAMDSDTVIEEEKVAADVKEISSDQVCVEVEVEVDEKTEVVVGEIQPEEEEAIISPLAWVESSDQVSEESTCQVAAADASAGCSRVRHSLSQMLLEECSEPEIIEWGNAENPPAMIYQKDVPKGLKRLLKFARKNRGETNAGSAWSSPYASEGEDEGDEPKGFGKKNSDSLLRKAALNATQHGQFGVSSDGHERNLADFEPLSARSNASNSSFQSTTSATSRASRSFFSLSAFRGNKGTETKMR